MGILNEATWWTSRVAAMVVAIDGREKKVTAGLCGDDER